MKLTLALVAVLTAAFIQPALAQGKGHGNDDAPGQGRGQSKGQGQGQGQGQGRGNSQAAVPPGNVVIADRDRNSVYSYYRGRTRPFCW